MKPPPEAQALLSRFATLSDLARLRTLRLLDGNELSVGELARSLQLPQSTVSRHLKLLHEGGWIVKRSEGTASLYQLVAEDLDDAASELWQIARTGMGDAPTLREDDRRLDEVLAERRADSRTFFGRIGHEWDRLRQELFGPLFTSEAMLGLVDPTWTLADVGCGTGNAAELIAPCVRTVIAIDREPAMLDAAQKRFAAHENVEFRLGSIEDLPLENGEVDAVLVLLVLHHLEHPAKAVKEMARVLAPDGLILVVDMVAHDRESYRHTMGHQHLGFDEQSIAAWAEAAGLTAVYRRLRPDTHAKGPGLFVAQLRRRRA